jgi:hypothetical protein
VAAMALGEEFPCRVEVLVGERPQLESGHAPRIRLQRE